MAVWKVGEATPDLGTNPYGIQSEEDSEGNFLTDTARDLGVGVIDIGGAVAGLGDLAASPFRDPGDGTFTQAYEDSPLGQWKRELQAGYSAERQAAEQEYQDYVEAGNGELDKFGRAILGAVTSPRVALGRLVQSAPAMAVSGGVGGAVGKATLARGASTNAAKWAGRAGSGAAEGLMSGGQAAGEIAEYNREQGYEPTRGMVAPVMTAAAVGSVGTIGGGMEAGLFNKSLREVGETSARSGWKAIPTTMVKEGFKEGGEEMAQSYFETVPTNRATDKEWNEGLGQSMGEGFAAGFGMGAALGPLSRNRKVEVMSGTEGADATYERSRPPSEAPTVDPATVAEDAGISMTGDVNADANAYIDANTEPAEEATPATGAAQPAPETTQSTPDVGVEPAAEPEAPEVLQVDEKGYRKLWSGVHDQSRSVSKRLLERTNEVLATPFGKDVVDAMVQANNAVGAHLSTERILNLVDNAIDESGSVEEAIETLRAQAADQEGRGKNSIPVSDLCAVAAEVLSGNSDPLQFLQGRMGERVVAEAQKARDKSLQKAEAKARARTGGEAPVELKGSADDVFKADDSPQVEGAPNAGVQNAPADDVIEAEIVGEREAEPANTQEEVPVNPASTTGEPVAPAEQQAAEPTPKPEDAPVTAIKPVPKQGAAAPVQAAESVQNAEPMPNPEPAAKPKAKPTPASESTPVDINKKAPWVKDEKKRVDFGPVPKAERINHVGDKPAMAGAVSQTTNKPAFEKELAIKTKVSELETTKPAPKAAPAAMEAVADGAFGFYQKRQTELANAGDEDSYTKAVAETLAQVPGTALSMSALTGLASRAEKAGSHEAAVGLLKAVASKASKLPDHDRRRVMDVVLGKADHMRFTQQEVDVILGKTAISTKAKQAAQDGDQSLALEELKALKRLSPDAVEAKDGALEELGKGEGFAALAGFKAAKKAPTEPTDTPNKGGQAQPVAPAKHTNAVAKSDADQRAHGKAVATGKAMWNPNEGRKVPANEQGPKVAKSVADMKPMENFAKAPRWVRQTREFAAKWFKIRGGWPTQEEYRDEIWPRLAEQENWTPAEMVDRRTGNAWTNRYFGDITRGSLKEPIRGTKETIREKKQSRVEAGKEAADRMLKEWAEHKKRLQAKKDAGGELKPFEQAVLDYDKPSEADVRAFALREFQAGRTSMRLYAKDFTADSYEKLGNPRRDRHGMNWDKKKNGEASVFKPGYKAEPEDVGASKEQVPAKVKGTDSALVMKGEEGTNIPDDVKASMELKRLEALPTREAKVKAVIDALRGIEDLPQTGAGSTRMSVTMAAIMATQKAAQLSSHSPAKWTKAQFKEVIEAISDVLNDKDLFTEKQKADLDELAVKVAMAADLNAEDINNLRREAALANEKDEAVDGEEGAEVDDDYNSDDRDSDAVGSDGVVNPQDEMFDADGDEVEAAEEHARYEEEHGRDRSGDAPSKYDTGEDDGYNHSWDDDEVGGASGGSINVESGRAGKSVVRRGQRAIERVARELGWIDAMSRDDSAEGFDAQFEENAQRIKDEFMSASPDSQQKIRDAIKEWGDAIKFDQLRMEDLIEIAMFAAEVGQISDDLEIAEAKGIKDRAYDTYKRKISTPTQPTPPKKPREKPPAKAQKPRRAKDAHLPSGSTVTGLARSETPLPPFISKKETEELASMLAARKAKTAAGEALKERARWIRVNNAASFDSPNLRVGRQAAANGNALRLVDIIEGATCADDLVGVYSKKFAYRLWDALQPLKALGVKEIPNTWVIDPSYDEAHSKYFEGGINNRALGAHGACNLAKGAHSIAVYEGGSWVRYKTTGPACFVMACFPKNNTTGLAARLTGATEKECLLHELVHAMDLMHSGGEISRPLAVKTSPEIEELFRLARRVNAAYMFYRENAKMKGVEHGLAAIAQKLNTPEISGEALVAHAHAICYPFTYAPVATRGKELLATAVSNYLLSEEYRTIIKTAAPTFAKTIEGIIKNDISNYQPARSSRGDDSGTGLSTEAGRVSREATTQAALHRRADVVRKEDAIRDSRSGSAIDYRGMQGTPKQEKGARRLPRDSDGDRGVYTDGNAKPVSPGAHGAGYGDGGAEYAPRLDGRASVMSGHVPSNRGIERAELERRGQGASALRGAASVESGSDVRPKARSVGEQGAQPPAAGIPRAEGKVRKHLRDFAPKGVRGQFLDALLNAADAAKTKLGLGLLFTRDLVNLARKAAPDVPAFKQWHELMERQAAYRNDWQAGVASINERFEALPKAVQPQVNRFLEAVTLEGLWPFRDPDVFATEEDFQKYKDKLSDEQKDTLAKLERDYEALPQSARSVVYSVLHHGVESRRTRANLMKGFVEERYSSLIDKATDKTTKAKWEKEKKDWIARCDSLAAQVRAPYVPLRRFGSHVVVRQSKKYEYTKRLAGQVYKTIQERTNGKPTKAQMAPFHKLQAELAKMQGDPEHYEVQFVDGAGTAKRHAKTLQDRYPDAIVESFARAEHVEGSIPSWQKLEQVITSAQQNLEIEKLALDPEANDHTAASLAEIMNAAQRMYIEALNDDNARKSELRRMRVAGYHTNMMENFMETGRAEANLFANMSYGAKVRKVLVDMQQEVKHSGNRAVAADYQNEMLKRHNQMLRGEGTSEAVNALLRTNSVVMLMTSPAYYLQNLLQPMMMSAPYMAGHHGMAASMEALGKTMAAAAKALRKGTSLKHIEEGMKLTKAEAEALRRARDLGHIDIGMTSDFGHITHSDAGEIKKAFAKVTDKMTEVSRRVEMVNRIGTFIAAYRLENARLKGKNPEAAWQYADEVVYKTHGDYSGINAPRLFAMNSMTKMATQFRKFQLIQAGMMIGLAARAFRNASPAEKALARRQLAWTMGIHFAMAGAKGTPFLATLLGLIGFAFGGAGDDEDDMIRDLIGDKQTSDLVLNGIPKMLGVDMSGKVGASNMFSLFPFMDTKPSEGEDFWKDLVVSAMGPTGSLGERALRGFAYASQGDWAKGAEAVAPTGIANLMKAIRFSTEGVTTKAGDVHIPGEEFTLFDGVMQAAGLPTNKTTDRNRIMGSLIRHEEWFDGQQSQLVHDYKEAWKARDSKSMMRLRREFLELNKLRREQGFKPAKMSVMTKAPIKQRKRELQGQGIGSTVGYKPSNRRFIEEQLKK